MTEEIYEKTIQTISDLLTDEEGWWTLSGEHPDAFGRLITDLALSAGSEEVVYLDTKIDYERTTAEVVVFTQYLLIRGTFAPEPTGQTHPAVRVVSASRRGLISFAASGRAVASTRDVRSEWPGAVKIEAVYDDGTTLSFPMSVVRSVVKRDGLLALLDSMRADLSR